jgi:serine protease Do
MAEDRSRQTLWRGPAGWFARVLLLLLLSWAAPAVSAGREEEDLAVLQQMGRAFASVAQRVSPGVVAVRSVRRMTQPAKSAEEPADPSREDFSGHIFRWRIPPDDSGPREYVRRAQGSGFVISAEGYILTNNHVIAEADKITVELGDGHTVDAEVVGADPESDVAVIKIKADRLAPVVLGDSERLQVGEWVLAVGNPLGLSHSVTAGIVSAKGRSGFNVTTYEDFIQTDAAINVGNSGGPLVNLRGEAVGINTFIVGSGGGNIGIGFAIPINIARDVANQIIRTGTVERGYLGIIPQDLTPELAEAFKLQEAKGVIISHVTDNSAAARAGIERGDVVLELGGTVIESAPQFRSLVAGRKPGEDVEIVVLRHGECRTVSARLDKRPSAREPRKEQPEAPALEQGPPRLGLTVEDLTPELAERFGFKDLTGVVITNVAPGSEAAEKGLLRGYMIKEVNQQAVNNVPQFTEVVTRAMAEKRRILLLVSNGQGSVYVLLNPPRE